jgi:hypothetical protein
MYTLGQAAKAVGKSKMTLSRAIKSGKLSAGRERHKGGVAGIYNRARYEVEKARAVQAWARPSDRLAPR